ncbi:hypothetical protein ACLBXM_16655 [Xanthobacteraceae bacterium A53D]
MKKLVVGIVVLGVVGAGGYFGFTQYVQSRAKSDVEAVFATLRQQGATATYKDVSFTLSGRVLTVNGVDIAGTKGEAGFKANQIVARGVSSPSGGMVQAASIELDGVAVNASGLAGEHATLVYDIPKLRIDNYQGPDKLAAPAPGNGKHPVLREVLMRFAAMRADSITAPELKGRLTPKDGAPKDAAVQPMEITYANLKASGIADGRIAEMAVDKTAYSWTLEKDGKKEVSSGEIANMRASGVDTRPIRAMTDATPQSSGPQPIYEKITAGPYTLKQGDGLSSSFGSMTLERLSIDPAALSFDRLDQITALAQRSNGDPSTEDTAKLLNMVADLLSGVAAGSIGMNDVAMTEKDGAAKIASINLKNLSKGRLELMEVNGVEGKTKDEKPVIFKRLAIMGLDMGEMTRLSAETLKSPKPHLTTSLGVFKAMAGIEIDGLVAPHEETGGQVKIEKTSVSWGDYVGALPTRFSLKIDKITGPISAEDGEPFSYLAATGMKEGTISAQLDIRYADGTLSIAPASFELDKAFGTSLEAKATDLPQAALQKPETLHEALLESKIGPMSLTISNLGIAELMLKQQAEELGVEPEELKAEFVTSAKEMASDLDTLSPDVASVGAAVVAFMEKPGTLTITVTPKKAMTWTDLMMLDDPTEALSDFTITATAKP